MGEGIELAIVGISVVFLFLSVMVGAIYGLGRLCGLAGARTVLEGPPGPEGAAEGESSLSRVAIAVAAIHHRRRRAGPDSGSAPPSRTST